MTKLILMCGYPYSGKTVLAKNIESHFGYERVDIDEIILEKGYDRFDDPRITAAELNKLFEEYYDKLRSLLRDGKTVISDTSNPTLRNRKFLKDLADRYGAGNLIIYLNISTEVVIERWKKNSTSGKRMQIKKETLENSFLEMEKPQDEENVIIFDGSLEYLEWIRKYMSILQN